MYFWEYISEHLGSWGAPFEKQCHRGRGGMTNKKPLPPFQLWLHHLWKVRRGEQLEVEEITGLYWKGQRRKCKEGRDVLDSKTPGNVETSETKAENSWINNQEDARHSRLSCKEVETRKNSVMDEVKLPGSIANTSKWYISQTGRVLIFFLWKHDCCEVYAARRHKRTLEQLLR